MPIYEYRCSSCGRVSEFFIRHGHGDGPLICKSCGSGELEKVLSLSAVSTRRESPLPSGRCCEEGTSCDSPKYCCTGGKP